jgi:hypothetical protein
MAPAELFSYFMQLGVGLHAAEETLRALYRVFGELNVDGRIISKGLWSPTSPDVNTSFSALGKTKKRCVCQQST